MEGEEEGFKIFPSLESELCAFLFLQLEEEEGKEEDEGEVGWGDMRRRRRKVV